MASSAMTRRCILALKECLAASDIIPIREERLRTLSFVAEREVMESTGFIGYFRGHYENDTLWQKFFWSQLFPMTKDFTDDFRSMLIAQKQFEDLNSMRDYCSECKEAQFSNEGNTEYAERIDTSNYSYLLRMLPEQGNLFAFCYNKEKLNEYLKNERKEK